MPAFNTTIDDVSPLITYLPLESWHFNTQENDNYSTAYANGTATLTSTQGATATFTFNGTGVWLYGAKRPNHGTYSVLLDRVQKFTGLSGSRSDGLRDLNARGNEFQAVLWGISNLSPGPHEVVITNEEAAYLDIDFITWESVIGTVSSPMNSSVLLPSDFKTNGAGWGTASTNSALNATSGIYTDAPGDSVIINFQVCDGVEIYGSTGTMCGLYDVQLDGGASTTYNASRYLTQSNQLLFVGAGLGSGQHTLVLTSDQMSNGSLVIDHAQVNVAESSTSTISPLTPPSTPGATNTSDGGTNKALVGGLVGALVTLGVLVMLAGLYLWLRRRKRQAPLSTMGTISKFEAFGSDRTSPPSTQGSIRAATLSELFRVNLDDEDHSDVSRASRKTGSSSGSRNHSNHSHHSHKTADLGSPYKSHGTKYRTRSDDSGGKGRHTHSPRRGYDEQPRIASPNHLSIDVRLGEASSSRIPDVSGSRPSSRSHGSHNRSYQHSPHDINPNRAARPLPTVPKIKSKSDMNVSIVNLPRPAPRPSQPHSRASIMKGGRRRSTRDSRILRAGYNFFFAKPGSSNSGSAYAPSTVLTSEISERPTTTLSPVTEIPPPPPPVPALPPQPSRPLQIVNQVDEETETELM
ncbi:uncharacterized protein FOMMEDRAFT_156465 [Fomitiporia mediterranea MF3/22]|uniref:uncharacterized protein n=1 Tax=Fomitiporia mediterranea (strain MF3/22) TaxID=694068 RepID=UPI0004409B86|nr:uncharacterized protein FOMMEDRAFT_156465 [Fomitiporia mediterranea MF3/22]EJD03095.1 hypothetical protein FOMMEDRAFT_156465 [Fomitiporia mediterranea MF3/22]